MAIVVLVILNIFALKERIIAQFVAQTNLEISNEIQNKKNALLAMAITMRTHQFIPADTSSLLERYTQYKNIWFRIYRKDRLLLAIPKERGCTKELFWPKEYQSEVTVDCFGAHLSAFVPQGSEKKLEVIGHFNSIWQNLFNLGVHSAILLDPAYYSYATHVERSIQNFKILQEDQDREIFQRLEKISLQNLLHRKKSIEKDGWILAAYSVLNAKKEPVVWIVFGQQREKILGKVIDAEILWRIFLLFLLVLSAIAGVVIWYLRFKDALQIRQHRYYRQILNTLQEVVLITDGERILFANQIFHRYFSGFKKLSDLFQNCCSCYEFEEGRGLVAQNCDPKEWIPKLLENREYPLYVKINMDEKERIFKLKANRVDGDFAIVFFDVTKEFLQQQELLDMAMKDPLTGLYNRRYFDQLVQEAILRANFVHEYLLIGVLDVDNFKHFNDRYGHDIGDQVLRVVAKAMKEHFRKSDLFFRLGGDEFAIVTPTKSVEAVLAHYEELRKDIESLQIPGIEDKVSVSIGVAQYKKGESLDRFFRRADEALYISKKAGRNTITFKGVEDDR